MKKIFLNLISGLVVTLTLVSCSDEKTKSHIQLFNLFENPSSISSWHPLTTEQSTPSILVVNQFNIPIENAQVLIGSALDVPFVNNLLMTDKNGQIQNINNWTTVEHVTADAQGYIRQTLLNQSPGILIIKLNTASMTKKAMLKGQVTKLPVVNGDKNIDLGLVMSTLTKSDLLNFDLNLLISPTNDVMKVATYDIAVPSNVSLPAQKEKYIFNLNIEKSEYHFFTSVPGPRRLVATAGRFPFKQVVDELRSGKPFYAVLNYFNLSGGSLRDVNILGSNTQLDIPGSELQFNAPISVASPKINEDEVFVALSASEVSGYFVPTGIREMASNTTASLKAIPNAPAFTVNILKKQTEFMSQSEGADRLSIAILPYQANSKPNLLPLVDNPTVNYSNGYTITLPNISATNGIFPLAISAYISEMSSTSSTTDLVRKWEIFGTNWPAQLTLPNWPMSASANQKRIEINYLGSTVQQDTNLGDDLIKAATHVTHSSVNF